MLSISYIKRATIDTAKWNACIESAPNGKIYAHSDYLDNMAVHWDALVAGNYEWVMPLTWNRKYGIDYLYQPPFAASLGIFGQEINEAIIKAFLDAIPSTFRLVEISLNEGNLLKAQIPGIYYRDNYILDLSCSYEHLTQKFRQNIIRNSQKAERSGCIYEKDIPVEPVIALSKELIKSLNPLPPDAFQRFEKLFSILYKQNKAVTRGVYTANRQLVASAVFFFFKERVYYILVGNHPNGKTVGASHFLLDRFINEFAGRPLLLDFEGSDIRGLAFFYSSFGALLEKYPAIKWNRLPWWVRWMK